MSSCDYIFIVNSTVSKYVLKGVNNKKFNKDKLFMVNSPTEAVNKINTTNRTLLIVFILIFLTLTGINNNIKIKYFKYLCV